MRCQCQFQYINKLSLSSCPTQPPLHCPRTTRMINSCRNSTTIILFASICRYVDSSRLKSSRVEAQVESSRVVVVVVDKAAANRRRQHLLQASLLYFPFFLSLSHSLTLSLLCVCASVCTTLPSSFSMSVIFKQLRQSANNIYEIARQETAAAARGAAATATTVSSADKPKKAEHNKSL